MAKSHSLNITINSIEGLPDCQDPGKIQIRYGKLSKVTSVKSPLRTGHSSDIMETLTFPLDGPAVQFDVYHMKGSALPCICAGGHVISTQPGYSYDGPVQLIDKTGGYCRDPRIYVSITIV